MRERGTNWWKLSTIAMVIAFEIARESAVIDAYRPAQAAAIFSVYRWYDNTTVEGQWKRIDGGKEPSNPETVKIECYKDKGQCIQASINTEDGPYVTPPDVSVNNAIFNKNGISYKREFPCVVKIVRIDLIQEAVVQYQLRNKEQKFFSCDGKFAPVKEKLGNSYDVIRDPMAGHFVPIMSGLRAVLGAKHHAA